MHKKTPVLRWHVKVCNRLIHHITYHRLEWFAGIGAVCFILGWTLHSEGFRHFAEFTGVPVIEAFLNRGEE
jgi:hypothetical protein